MEYEPHIIDLIFGRLSSTKLSFFLPWAHQNSSSVHVNGIVEWTPCQCLEDSEQNLSPTIPSSLSPQEMVTVLCHNSGVLDGPLKFFAWYFKIKNCCILYCIINFFLSSLHFNSLIILRYDTFDCIPAEQNLNPT